MEDSERDHLEFRPPFGEAQRFVEAAGVVPELPKRLPSGSEANSSPSEAYSSSSEEFRSLSEISDLLQDEAVSLADDVRYWRRGCLFFVCKPDQQGACACRVLECGHARDVDCCIKL